MSIGKIQVAAIASTMLALLASRTPMLASLGNASPAATGEVASALLLLLLLAPIPANLLLAVKSRSQPVPFVFAIAALVLAAATIAIVLIWILPAHRGPMLPASLERLRSPWIYADAESGVLGFIALGAAAGARLCWEEGSATNVALGNYSDGLR